MLRSNNRLTVALILVAMILASPGCGKKESPAPATPPAKAAPSASPAVPVQKQVSSAVMAGPATMASEFVSRKDPFKPLVSDSKNATQGIRRNRLGQALPILNYDLSQFKVTGIIVGLKENRAQVVDPTGKPYVVKAGMEMGRNLGRITRITPSYVEVFERYRDESGKLVKNTVRLALPKKQ